MPSQVRPRQIRSDQVRPGQIKYADLFDLAIPGAENMVPKMCSAYIIKHVLKVNVPKGPGGSRVCYTSQTPRRCIRTKNMIAIITLKYLLIMVSNIRPDLSNKLCVIAGLSQDSLPEPVSLEAIGFGQGSQKVAQRINSLLLGINGRRIKHARHTLYVVNSQAGFDRPRAESK